MSRDDSEAHSEEDGEQCRKRELSSIEEENRGTGGAEDLEQRRLAAAAACSCSKRAEEDENTGSEDHARKRGDDHRDLREEIDRSLQRAADLEYQHAGESLGYSGDNGLFLLGRDADDGGVGGAEAFYGTWREDEGDVGAEAGPVDLADGADLGLDLQHEDAQADAAADFQAEALGDALLHRDERRA